MMPLISNPEIRGGGSWVAEGVVLELTNDNQLSARIAG